LEAQREEEKKKAEIAVATAAAAATSAKKSKKGKKKGKGTATTPLSSTETESTATTEEAIDSPTPLVTPVTVTASLPIAQPSSMTPSDPQPSSSPVAVGASVTGSPSSSPSATTLGTPRSRGRHERGKSSWGVGPSGGLELILTPPSGAAHKRLPSGASAMDFTEASNLSEAKRIQEEKRRNELIPSPTTSATTTATSPTTTTATTTIAVAPIDDASKLLAATELQHQRDREREQATVAAIQAAAAAALAAAHAATVAAEAAASLVATTSQTSPRTSSVVEATNVNVGTTSKELKQDKVDAHVSVVPGKTTIDDSKLAIAVDAVPNVSTGASPLSPLAPSLVGPVIDDDQLAKIKELVSKFDHLETGGDLFGYWGGRDRDIPIVLYVLGPGPNVKRTATSFFQDEKYLETKGNELRALGLEHIGEWHSHHHLSLIQPSAGDYTTVVNAMKSYERDHFLLCICNFNETEAVDVRPYVFYATTQQYELRSWTLSGKPCRFQLPESLWYQSNPKLCQSIASLVKLAFGTCAIQRGTYTKSITFTFDSSQSQPCELWFPNEFPIAKARFRVAGGDRGEVNHGTATTPIDDVDVGAFIGDIKWLTSPVSHVILGLFIPTHVMSCHVINCDYR
jgi:hypothetical protein